MTGGTLAALAVPGAALIRRDRWAAPLLRAAAALFGLGFLVLCYRFATTDTRLVVVADYSRRSGTLPFRIAGAWAGLEGSLLLWTTLAAAVGALAVRRGGAAWYGAVAAAFGGVGLAFANPFLRLSLPPLDGAGITPILEHPAMLFHPLLVYGGLVALVVPLALALSQPVGWLAHARRWATATWGLLTFALFTGATWAYVEVGWGGYWAWDPVENGALIPWLFGLGFLHGSRPTSPLGSRSVVGLAGLPFVGVLIGATVTRSGWAASVHSFGEGRTVGVCFVVLTVLAGTALVIVALRTASTTTPATPDLDHPPRAAGVDAGAAARVRGETGLVVVSVAAVGAGVLVAMGTLWPFVAQLFGGRNRVVAGSFFAWAVAAAAARRRRSVGGACGSAGGRRCGRSRRGAGLVAGAGNWAGAVGGRGVGSHGSRAWWHAPRGVAAAGCGGSRRVRSLAAGRGGHHGGGGAVGVVGPWRCCRRGALCAGKRRRGGRRRTGRVDGSGGGIHWGVAGRGRCRSVATVARRLRRPRPNPPRDRTPNRCAGRPPGEPRLGRRPGQPPHDGPVDPPHRTGLGGRAAPGRRRARLPPPGPSRPAETRYRARRAGASVTRQRANGRRWNKLAPWSGGSTARTSSRHLRPWNRSGRA